MSNLKRINSLPNSTRKPDQIQGEKDLFLLNKTNVWRKFRLFSVNQVDSTAERVKAWAGNGRKSSLSKATIISHRLMEGQPGTTIYRSERKKETVEAVNFNENSNKSEKEIEPFHKIFTVQCTHRNCFPLNGNYGVVNGIDVFELNNKGSVHAYKSFGRKLFL
jgi:hypothetical protein